MPSPHAPCLPAYPAPPSLPLRSPPPAFWRCRASRELCTPQTTKSAPLTNKQLRSAMSPPTNSIPAGHGQRATGGGDASFGPASGPVKPPARTKLCNASRGGWNDDARSPPLPPRAVMTSFAEWPPGAQAAEALSRRVSELPPHSHPCYATILDASHADAEPSVLARRERAGAPGRLCASRPTSAAPSRPLSMLRYPPPISLASLFPS